MDPAISAYWVTQCHVTYNDSLHSDRRYKFALSLLRLFVGLSSGGEKGYFIWYVTTLKTRHPGIVVRFLGDATNLSLS
jgi:hypothetical protein